MKINQAAELAGITSKNIRFYEDQGLIAPARDSSNGYRDYSMEDVEQLCRIKLLRMLGISCPVRTSAGFNPVSWILTLAWMIAWQNLRRPAAISNT